MKILTFLCVLLTLTACNGNRTRPVLPAPNLNPVIAMPAGAVITGATLLRAQERGNQVPLSQLQARFEIARDDGVWQPIGGFSDALNNALSDTRFGEFGIVWDSASVASGAYSLRVGTRLQSGPWQWSMPVTIVVNRAPRAQVVAQRPAQLALAGTVSFLVEADDPDGEVVDVRWDFGDGENASGPQVTHVFRDTTKRYEISVVLIDDRGAITSLYYELNLTPEIVLEEQRAACSCKSIALRKTGAALGPDAMPNGSEWAPQDGFDDGKTLGPRDKNPGNSEVGGEKRKTGYLFEILAEVTGTPSSCKEGQLIQGDYYICGFSAADCSAYGGTRDGNGCCSFGTPWTGTQVDLDQDGTDDIDVSTMALCTAMGGRWDATTMRCSLNFPKSNGYKPDTLRGAKSGYDAPDGGRKAYAGKKVVFFDSPSAPLSATNGSKFDGELLTYLRGTDNKYCYVRTQLKYERKAGPDMETLDEIETKIGVNALPGI